MNEIACEEVMAALYCAGKYQGKRQLRIEGKASMGFLPFFFFFSFYLFEMFSL